MIAIQLYTLRSMLQDPSRVGDVLSRLREIGYQSVEVAGLGPDSLRPFGAELKRAGLTACAAHVSLDRLTSDPDGVVAECRDWGCEFVVIPSLPERYQSRDGYQTFALEAVELAKRLRRHGLHLAYHNHAFELERFGRETGLELLLGRGMQAELDTYWLQFGGASPAEWIRRFAQRVPLVHVKDMAVDRGRPFDAEVGEGNLNWRDILDACRDAGTRWLVVEQDQTRRDPMESVAISYRNLTRMTDGVGLEA